MKKKRKSVSPSRNQRAAKRSEDKSENKRKTKENCGVDWGELGASISSEAPVFGDVRRRRRRRGRKEGRKVVGAGGEEGRKEGKG